MNCEEFCFDSYQKEFEKKFKIFYDAGEASSDTKKLKARTASQKFAVKETLKNALLMYPLECPSLIWRYVEKAHILKFTGLKIEPEVIKKVISAEQSWKKSSGHAFEEYIKDEANPLLLSSNIELLLQRDVTELKHAGKLVMPQKDLVWVDSQLADSSFDLFMAIRQGSAYRLFGCLQAKTSIRDRVSRDREPSIQAMKNFFISYAIVLDGEFLKLKKFNGMVHGNTDRFKENGWHAMYTFSKPDGVQGKRIKQVNKNLTPFIEDCIKASQAWLRERQWIDPTWMP